MKKTIIAVSAIAALTLLSCSKKKDTNTPTPAATSDTATQVDVAKLTASDWHGVSAYNLYYDANWNLTGADGASKYYQHDGMLWVDSMEEKFTFHADGTYDHSRADGGTGWDYFSIFIPAQGIWALKDDNHTFTISFDDGQYGPHKEDFKVAAFTDHYLHLTYTDSLHPQKDVYHMEFVR